MAYVRIHLYVVIGGVVRENIPYGSSVHCLYSVDW